MKTIPIAAAGVATPGAHAPRLAAPPPLSLYVHFPWCIRKCPYCDFNSHPFRGAIPEGAYVNALLADLEGSLPGIWGRRINSVFIGGGTPSLLSPRALERLLDGVRMLGNPAPGAEITLEANPGAADAGRFAEFRAAGVTRLSVGVQSFDDAALERIGRVHDGAAARAAVELALASFERVNLDLMYGLPGQDLAAAARDLTIALDYRPGHLSCYQLTIEPNTEFHARPPRLPDHDQAADMQEMIERELAEAGFQHYETSAFARPGERCRHNLNYWQFGDYLGIGAGAHGKLSAHHGIHRETRHRHPAAYLEAAARGEFVREARPVAAADLPFEFMMNALRLVEGVPRALYPAVTGLSLAALEPRLERARRDGLLADDPERLVPSARGRRFLNDLLQCFLPEPEG